MMILLIEKGQASVRGRPHEQGGDDVLARHRPRDRYISSASFFHLLLEAHYRPCFTGSTGPIIRLREVPKWTTVGPPAVVTNHNLP